MIAVELSDPREELLPDVGLVKFSDAESGAERWVDTGSPALRGEFVKYWETRRSARKSLFIRSRVDAIPIRIDRPYIKPIVDFFKLREHRL